MAIDTHHVPYVDMARETAPLQAALLEAVERVLRGGVFILGKEVEAFEAEFATYCGSRYAVAVANGTDALVLALRALGIGPGDEVITVPNSFLASASCIALTGARPVFVDVRDDFNIDPDHLEEAITARTRAILPVHLYGRPADMDAVLAVADRHGLPVVEDAAQAAGATYRGRQVGSIGRIGCFSLHPNKTLGACGDAGIIVTDNPDIRTFLVKARNHGLGANRCEFWSINSRLDPIQAAMLRVKLPHLDGWNARRRAIAARYREALDNIVTPADPDFGESAYHIFAIRTPERNALRRHLDERGIETRVHYEVPLHLHPAGASLGYGKGAFPITERLAEEILSLPLFTAMTDREVEAVIDGVRTFRTG